MPKTPRQLGIAFRLHRLLITRSGALCLNIVYDVLAIFFLAALAPLCLQLVDILSGPAEKDDVPLDLDMELTKSPLNLFGVQYDLSAVDPGRLDSSGAEGLLGEMDHLWSDIAGPLPYAEVISNSSSDADELTSAILENLHSLTFGVLFRDYLPCESLDLLTASFSTSASLPFFVEKVFPAFKRDCLAFGGDNSEAFSGKPLNGPPFAPSSDYDFNVTYLNMPTRAPGAELAIPLVSMVLGLMCFIPIQAFFGYFTPSTEARIAGRLWALQVAGLDTVDYHLGLQVVVLLFYGIPQFICQVLTVWGSGALFQVNILVWLVPTLICDVYTIALAAVFAQRFSSAFSYKQWYSLVLFLLLYLPVMVAPFLEYVFPPALTSLLSIFPTCSFIHALYVCMTISIGRGDFSPDGDRAPSSADLGTGFFNNCLLLDCVIQIAMIALFEWATVASDQFVPKKFPKRAKRYAPPCDDTLPLLRAEAAAEIDEEGAAEPGQVVEAVIPLDAGRGIQGFVPVHKAGKGCLGLNVGRERLAVARYCAGVERDPSILAFRDVTQVFVKNSKRKAAKTENRINALRHVSLMATSAEGSNVTCLIGPNGSGKTTLFRSAMLAFKPTEGAVYLGGEDTTESGNLRTLVKKIGICMQDDVGVFQNLTAEENLRLYSDIVARAKGREGVRQPGWMPDGAIPLPEWTIMKKIVDDDFLGLKEYLGVRARNLSGGWRRRLSVACALANDPEILLLDEATSGLDLEARNRLWAEIRAVSRGRTLLVTTHSLDEADKYCDKLVFMYKGRIVCVGTANEIKCHSDGLGNLTLLRGGYGSAPGLWERGTAELERRFPGLSPLPSAAGAKRYRFSLSQHKIEEVFAACVELKEENAVSDFSLTQPTLDQIFLSLMQDAEEYFAAE